MWVIETELDKILQMKAMDPSCINLDSYATRHMTPYFVLENQEDYNVPIIVGNNETLHSTHRGSLRINKVVFNDVLFVPGLMQTLISEPQLEMKGCRIVSEHGVRTVYKGDRIVLK